MKKITSPKKITSSIFLLLLGAFSPQIFAHDIAEEGSIVRDPESKFFSLVKQHPELIIDHRNKEQFEVYGPVGTVKWLKTLGAEILPLDHNEEEKAWGSGSYPTPEEIEEKLKIIVANHSDIMTLTSLGQSALGRELWVVKVSDNPSQDEVEPEVKYIANMHGNEIVGREMMVLFLEDLGNRYKAGEKKIVSLINETEVFIMPSMNPDGAANKRRGNDGWKDLNRNFPDFSTRDNQNDSTGRELETVAVMNWQEQQNFALSANFHGGTKVVNYPWDTSRDKAPLTDLVVSFSKEYADHVPGFFDSTEFDGGIVNGNAWYEVDGGMQDWSYYFYNDLQVTIELSHSKWPNYKNIAGYYDDNKDSLVQFLSRVHQGQGIKFSGAKDPSSIAITRILNSGNKDLGTFDVRHREFYKVLPIGQYQFKISYLDGSSETKDIQVNFNQDNYKADYLNL